MSAEIEKINQDMEKFLLQLKDEIEIITNPLNNSDLDLPAIDKYLHEINSFYYRSFHSHFMPVYEREIKQEIAELLHLSRQEEMIKKDLVANLRRYAKLYNQVKTLTGLLGNYRSDIYSRLLSAVIPKDQGIIDLRYGLKQLQNSLNNLQAMTGGLIEILSNQDLMTTLAYSPLCLHAVQMVAALDINNISTAKNLNSFLLNLELIRNYLLKLDSSDYGSAGKAIINDIKNLITRPKMKLLPPIQSFYNKILRPILNQQIELITLYLEKENLARAGELAGRLAELLYNLLQAADQSLVYLSKIDPYLFNSLLSSGTPVNANMLSRLEKQTEQTLLAVNDILHQLNPSADQDFSYFSSRTQEVIEQAYTYYQETSNNLNIKNLGNLYAGMNRLTSDLLQLEDKIFLTNYKYQHWEQASDLFLAMVNMVDTYLNLLADTRADLERLLTPRNLIRVWKDMDIRIERLTIEKDRVFPAEYRYILDKCGVETRVTDDIDMTVLHEEGDIFIIRVDEIVEEEVPYLIVSMKGQ